MVLWRTLLDLGGYLRKGEPGDLVRLSATFFDEKQVSDEAIERLQSELTIVLGKGVYPAID